MQSWGVAEGEKVYLITKGAGDAVTLSTRNMTKVVQIDITHRNV
jgi:large subunit ribosomal protein L4